VSLSCVIYARVSTKEQHEEGYSIPAQLKAMRAFCASEGLSPLAEFVETESAGHAGRTQFGRMLDFFRANPRCRTVVAHKLDRLYRNFADQVALEEQLGVRARYVLGDVPDTPQGALIRDVQLSVSKFYLGNLAEEVKKGMEEKVAQGGWGHKAPVGYLNDKNTRSVVVDPYKGPLVAWAFERYASGVVSVSGLADELYGRGFTRKNGAKLLTSALHKMLRNPFYCGRMVYKGEVYAGAHTPLVSAALFEQVQERLGANRNGTKPRTKRVYALRGAMRCAECGCLITAGTHNQHVYYRCTHGKGECSQRSYIREDALMAEVESILGRVELTSEIVEALVADCESLLEEKSGELAKSLQIARSEVAAVTSKEKKLLDAYLDGAVPAEVYRERAEELASTRRALELRISEAERQGLQPIEQLRDVALVAASARLRFQDAADEDKREVIQTVLCNFDEQEGHIASYQYKDPFALLEKEPSGAFKYEWWAILDLNQ
jgi:DNA invertase Pin-like site-specific DNA recombinase